MGEVHSSIQGVEYSVWINVPRLPLLPRSLGGASTASTEACNFHDALGELPPHPWKLPPLPRKLVEPSTTSMKCWRTSTSTDASIALLDVKLASTTSMEVVGASATSLKPCELCETSTASVEADTNSLEACCTHIQIAQDTGLFVSFIVG